MGCWAPAWSGEHGWWWSSLGLELGYGSRPQSWQSSPERVINCNELELKKRKSWTPPYKMQTTNPVINKIEFNYFWMVLMVSFQLTIYLWHIRVLWLFCPILGIDLIPRQQDKDGYYIISRCIVAVIHLFIVSFWNDLIPNSVTQWSFFVDLWPINSFCFFSSF